MLSNFCKNFILSFSCFEPDRLRGCFEFNFKISRFFFLVVTRCIFTKQVSCFSFPFRNLYIIVPLGTKIMIEHIFG